MNKSARRSMRVLYMTYWDFRTSVVVGAGENVHRSHKISLVFEYVYGW